jgi:hypothetical protein
MMPPESLDVYKLFIPISVILSNGQQSACCLYLESSCPLGSKDSKLLSPEEFYAQLEPCHRILPAHPASLVPLDF